MSARRPTASPRSSALPTLVALLAAGVSVEGCLNDAHAQTPPGRDGGVRPPSHPPQPPHPPIPPAGGIPPVQPHPPTHPPTPPTPPTTQRPEPPVAVPGGIGKVSAG